MKKKKRSAKVMLSISSMLFVYKKRMGQLLLSPLV